MKFDSSKIAGLFVNEKDVVGNTIRGIEVRERIVVAQGFGVDEEVPLRFLAYVVPVLHLARQLPKSASVEFYFALEGVLRANPYVEEARVRESAYTMGGLIRR